ncbi:MAG: glycogen debranching enzyme, partial [Thermoleophilaceae bacterium]
CQDNEISWFSWDHDERGRRLLDFTRALIRLRRSHPVFRRRAFLTGEERMGSGLPDAWWFRTDGRRMTRRDWEQPDGHVVGAFLNGEEIPSPDERGERVVDDSFLVLFNASGEDVSFRLPSRRFGALWELELSTAEPELEAGSRAYRTREEVPLVGRSLMVLRRMT